MPVLVMPASTRATRLVRSMESTLFMRVRQSTMASSSGKAPPDREVPAPRGTTLTWFSWQKRRIALTSSVDSGSTTASGRGGEGGGGAGFKGGGGSPAGGRGG